MASDQLWPNLFIVGAPRAGTTSLWRYLSEHPEIFMTAVKEPNFFSQLDRAITKSVEDESRYLGLFAPGVDQPWRGEASPSYLRDREAAHAIARVNPEARVIILLRDPIDRAHSHYWHTIRFDAERRSFTDVIREELARDAYADPEVFSYLRCGLYADDVKRYRELFGDNLLTLLFDDLARDPEAVTRQVFEWLGVPPEAARPIDFVAYNAFSLPRNRLTKLLYASPAIRRIGLRVVPSSLRYPLEGTMLRGGKKPPIEAATRSVLERFYQQDTNDLSELIAIPLPWASEDRAIASAG
jgi:hypothetical protein